MALKASQDFISKAHRVVQMECLGIGLTQCANHSSQQGRSPQQYTVDTTHGGQAKLASGSVEA
jgi:hypothetical protein